MSEDLLINIDVDAKKANKSTNDFTSNLNKNNKTIKDVIEQLNKLKKQYESLKQATKGFQKKNKDLRDSLKGVSESSVTATKNLSKIKDSSKSLKNTSGNIQSLNKSVSSLALATNNSANAVKTFSSSFGVLSIAISNALSVMRLFSSIYTFITDRARIERLVRLMKILSIFLVSKGKFKLASRVNKSANSINGLSLSLENFKSKSKLLDLGFTDIISSVTNFQQSILSIINVFRNFKIAFEKMTNKETLKRLSGALKIIGVLMTFRGKVALGERFLEASKKVDIFSTKLNEVSKFSFGDLVQTAEKAETVIDSIKTVTETLTSSLKVGAIAFVSSGIVNTLKLAGFNANSTLNSINKLKTSFAQLSKINFSLKELQGLNKNIFELFSRLTLIAGSPLLSFEHLKISSDLLAESLKKSALSARLVFSRIRGISSNKEVFKDFIGSLSLVKNDLSLLGESIVKVAKKPSLLKDGFSQTVKQLKGLKQSFKTTRKIIDLKFSKALFHASEASAILKPSLIGLGLALRASDKTFVKFSGTVILLATVALAGLASVMSLVTKAVGNLLISIGDNLISKMSEWEKKSAKVASSTAKFAFVINGFSKKLGSETVGGLKKWNSVLSDITKNSLSSATAVRGSIKVLIAEGSALGVSVSDNEKILKRAVDISALTGIGLEDVTLRIVKALGGNADSLKSLGIFVDKATLQHSKFAKEQDLVIANLDKNALAQVTLNEILEQTSPLMGGALDQVNTIAGANKRYENILSSLAIQLGRQGTFTVLYKTTINNLLSSLLKLPDAIVNVVGSSIDFVGVTFKIVGVITKYSLLVSTLISIYALLTSQTVIVAGAQKIATLTFSLAGGAIGVETVAVTSLSVAFTNFVLLIKGSFLFLMDKVLIVMNLMIAKTTAMTISLFRAGTAMLFTKAGWVTMIKGAWGATKAVTAFTISILRNPLFIQGALIVGSVLALIQAFRELKKELGVLSPTLKKTSESAKDIESSFQGIFNFIKNTFRFIVNVAKTLLLSFVILGKSLQILVNKFLVMKARVFGTTEEVRKLKKEQEALKESGRRVSLSFVENFLKVTEGFENTANASDKLSDKMDKIKKKAEEVGRGFSKAFLAPKEALEDLNKTTFATGTEKLLFNIEKSKKALNRLRDQGVIKIDTQIIPINSSSLDKFVSGGFDTKDVKAKIVPATDKQLLEATIALEKNRLALVKSRGDLVSSLSEKLQKLNIKELSDNNNRVLALKKEGQIKLDAFRKQISELEKINGLTKSEKLLVEKIEASLKNQTKSQIAKFELEQSKKKTQELEKQAKLINDLQKTISKLNQDNVKGSGNALAIAQITFENRTKEISLLEERLKLQENFTTLNEDGTRVLNDGIQKSIDKAKELNKITFDKKVIEIEQRKVGDKLGGVAKGIESFTLPFTAFMEGVDKITGVIQKLIDFIPATLDKITKIFTSLTELPKKILGSVKDLVKGIGSFIKDFIPNLFEALPDLLLEVFSRLPDTIVSAFQTLLERLPELVNKLIKGLLDALPQIISSLVNMMPDIAIAFTLAIIKNADKIAFAIAKALVVDLPKAIAKGVAEAIKRAIGSIGGLFDGITQKITGTFSAGLESLSTTSTQEAGKLFALLDIQKQSEGLSTANNIKEAIMDGGNWLSDRWNDLMQSFRDAGKWISDGWKKAWSIITGVFTKLIIEPWRKVWSGFLAVLKGVGDALSAVFEVARTIFETVAGVFKKAFKWIEEKIWNPIKSAFEKLFNGLVDIVKVPFNAIIDVLNALKIPEVSVSEKVFGKRFSFTLIPDIDLIPGEIARLAKGGLVSGGTKGVDSVPAMLMPNEFVLRADAVKNIGVSTLNAMNQGRFNIPTRNNVISLPTNLNRNTQGTGTAGQTFNFNLSMSVQTSEKIDDNFIRTRVVPSLRNEIKQASLRGEFIISNKGLRET